MFRRFLVLVAACGLLLTPSTRTLAAGGGVKLGPATAFPSLNVTETYTDNFLLATSEAESDWGTSINPALRLLLPTRSLFLIAEGGLDYRSYSDHEEENSTDWYVGATVGGDFPGGLSFKVSDRYTETYVVGSEEFGPGEETALNTFEAKVAYSRRDVLKLELAGTRSSHDFESSLALIREETTVTASAFWKFRPAVSALLEVGLNGIGYDTNTVQDNDSAQVALGFTWDVTTRSTGLVKVGYQWKDYNTESMELGTRDASYYTVAAGFKHAFSRRTNLLGELTRSSRENDVSDFSANPYYLETKAGLSLSQRIATKSYLRAGVRYQLDNYPNETSYEGEFDKRDDTTLAGILGVGYDVTRWLTLEFEFNREQRDSTFDTFDYTVTRYILSAKAAF